MCVVHCWVGSAGKVAGSFTISKLKTDIYVHVLLYWDFLKRKVKAKTMGFRQLHASLRFLFGQWCFRVLRGADATGLPVCKRLAGVVKQFSKNSCTASNDHVLHAAYTVWLVYLNGSVLIIQASFHNCPSPGHHVVWYLRVSCKCWERCSGFSDSAHLWLLFTHYSCFVSAFTSSNILWRWICLHVSSWLWVLVETVC